MTTIVTQLLCLATGLVVAYLFVHNPSNANVRKLKTLALMIYLFLTWWVIDWQLSAGFPEGMSEGARTFFIVLPIFLNALSAFGPLIGVMKLRSSILNLKDDRSRTRKNEDWTEVR